MKNVKWKSLLFTMAFSGVAAAAPTDGESIVSAAPSCAGAGYLCFYDYNSAQYGNLSGTNPDWRTFGWNDRADIFRNNGTSYNACVYQDINYRTRAWFIPRNGTWYDVPDNTVSSNKWTSGPNVGYCF